MPGKKTGGSEKPPPGPIFHLDLDLASFLTRITALPLTRKTRANMKVPKPVSQSDRFPIATAAEQSLRSPSALIAALFAILLGWSYATNGVILGECFYFMLFGGRFNEMQNGRTRFLKLIGMETF